MAFSDIGIDLGTARILVYVKGKGVVAYTASSTNYESTNTNLTRAQLKQECNKSSTGLYCAALIMKDGWQIKDDYPW